MADVKWIKIVTDIFDDEKILLIEALPNGSEYVLIWFKLLCLAGKLNSGGALIVGDGIALDAQALATLLHRRDELVRKALETFRVFGMITKDGDVLKITNWEKHQSSEKMDEIREYNRQAQQRRRARVNDKSMTESANVNDNVNDKSMTESANVNDCQGTEEEEEIDIYSSSSPPIVPPTPSGAEGTDAETGLLTAKERERLVATMGADRLEFYLVKMQSFIASEGKTYKNPAATIEKWYREDMEPARRRERQRDKKPAGSFETDEFFNAALRKSYSGSAEEASEQ